MRIVVTGASGFIGRKLIEELLKSIQPKDLALVTRDKDNIDARFRDLEVYELNIEDQDAAAFLKDRMPDILVHLAWDRLDNFKHMAHVTDILTGHYGFLSKMIENGLPRLFVLGTCLEYGMRNGACDPSDVSDPQISYPVAKDTLRKQLQILRGDFDFQFIWARLFYIYGEGQPSRALLPQLKSAVEKKLEYFNMSNGEQLRDYLSVEDVAYQIAQLVLFEKRSVLTNICSGAPISVRDLVEQWINENNWDIKLNRGFYSVPNFEPVSFWGTQSRFEMDSPK